VEGRDGGPERRVERDRPRVPEHERHHDASAAGVAGVIQPRAPRGSALAHAGAKRRAIADRGGEAHAARPLPIRRRFKEGGCKDRRESGHEEVPMNEDLERRVVKLEAAEAIRRLKARYARVCDTGYEPDRMVPLFTKDAVWDGGERFGRYEGIDAIYGFFTSVSSQIVWALHYMVAPAIEVNDDLETATGSWYLWQPCTIVAEQGARAVWLTGTYADRYRNDAGVWKFAEVRLDCQTITPFEEGWVRRPFWNEESQ
jgi:hypothetical protein